MKSLQMVLEQNPFNKSITIAFWPHCKVYSWSNLILLKSCWNCNQFKPEELPGMLTAQIYKSMADKYNAITHEATRFLRWRLIIIWIRSYMFRTPPAILTG
jgi:hypothetical protein